MSNQPTDTWAVLVALSSVPSCEALATRLALARGRPIALRALAMLPPPLSLLPPLLLPFLASLCLFSFDVPCFSLKPTSRTFSENLPMITLDCLNSCCAPGGQSASTQRRLACVRLGPPQVASQDPCGLSQFAARGGNCRACLVPVLAGLQSTKGQHAGLTAERTPEGRHGTRKSELVDLAAELHYHAKRCTFLMHNFEACNAVPRPHV